MIFFKNRLKNKPIFLKNVKFIAFNAKICIDFLKVSFKSYF